MSCNIYCSNVRLIFCHFLTFLSYDLSLLCRDLPTHIQSMKLPLKGWLDTSGTYAKTRDLILQNVDMSQSQFRH